MADTDDASNEQLDEVLRDEIIAEGGCLSLLGAADDVDRLRYYLGTLEGVISKMEGEEFDSLQRDTATLPEGRRGRFWEWNYPAHWDQIFRTNLRSSLLVSLASLVETNLDRACANVEIIARAPLASGALRGSALERARVFLRAFGKFERPATDQWALVERIFDVRNVLVHHARFIGTYNNARRVLQFVEAQPGLREEQGHIHLGSEFCPFALATAREFLGAVEAELAALCARVRQFERR